MKILFVHSSGNNIAGSEIVLLGMLEGFADKFSVEVLLSETGIFYDRLLEMGITVYVTPFSQFDRRHPTRWIQSVFSFLVIVKKVRPDIVHLTSASPMQYVFPTTKALNIPLVCHVQCPYDAGNMKRYQPWQADQVVLVSKTLVQTFPADKRDNLSVVYNGIDLPKIDRHTSKRLNVEKFQLPSCSPVIGMVGQIIPRKGIDIFLRAAKKMIRIIPDIRLLIVGNADSEYGRQLKQLAYKLGVSENVVWVGFQSNPQQIMAGLDALAVPSRSEAFGLVAAEAMAVGTPVVASRVDGLPEVIQDGLNGFLVPSEDQEFLVCGLMGILRNPGLAISLRQEGRRTVQEKFSVAAHLVGIESVYREVLAKKGGQCETTRDHQDSLAEEVFHPHA